MRKNITKEKLLKGESAFGVFCGINAPAIVEMMGVVGFDFVLIDGEHGPMDLETCEHMIRASDVVGITPITRIAMNVRQNILRYLDAGALGVLIPMVNTKAEAQAVVDAVKYPPVGKRGLAGVRANMFGLTGSLTDYVTQSNQETLVITQVETLEAVKNLPEMLQVQGIDCVFVGPTDLSTAMGYPGQTAHPEVEAMIQKLVKQITSAGKPAGTIAYDLDTLKRRKEQGFTFISAGVNPLLVKASRDYLAAAKGR